MFEGNPLFDLARFIVCAADADVRREHARRAIQVFHARLVEKYAEHNEKPKFSLEDVSETKIIGAHFCQF